MTKLFTIIIVVVIGVFNTNSISAQNLSWVSQFGQKGLGTELNTVMTISAEGKKYIAGSYYGTIIFDNGSINDSISKYSSGYIAEVLDDGTVNYITTLQETSITAISTTAKGDIIVGGYIAGANKDTLLGTYISFDSEHAYYIACISPNAELKWINVTNSNYGAGEMSALHQKADGGIVVGFKFFKDFTMDNTQIVTGNGRYKGLGLAELNPTTGKMEKLIRLSNTTGSFPKVVRICSDDQNNIFLYGQLAYENHILGLDVDNEDKFAFTAKLNSNFERIWLKHYPNSENNYTEAMDMEMDKNYNMYLTANFRGKIKIGKDSITAYGSNWLDGLVAKIDSSGNTIWAKRFGGNNAEEVSGLAIDSLNNIYLFGSHSDFSEIGDTVLRSYGVGANRVFLTRLDSNGHFNWIFQGGGPNNEKTGDLAIYNNKLYASGMFGLKSGGTNKTTADFGSYHLTAPNGAGNNYVLAFNLTDIPTSLPNNTLTEQLRLQVYPNPSNGISNIWINNHSTKNIHYQVYNINGQQVQNGQLSINEQGKTQVNLAELPKGMYLLQIHTNGTFLQHKIYKQ